jgi:fructuronate reductase
MVLTQKALGSLPSTVARPTYDRAAVTTGIVHFGPGAFHRVHQAWFIEKALRNDPRWGICEVSLRSTDVRDALVPQDGLYTIAEFDEVTSFEVIGAVKEILVAPENPETVLKRLCSPNVHIVTMTVTEKGYCLGADGTLDLSHRDIVRDLNSPQAPVSLVGYLVEALARRRAAGLPPLTIISCDNLVDNGTRLRNAVTRLAETRDRELAAWISGSVAFPRTMVDSITPATTDALRDKVANVLGVKDAWPVQRESFVQWVIEDRFSSPVPDWSSVGVTITDDVPAYDRAKLRLLNGAHSTLAYVGTLAGYETVAQAIGDVNLRDFVRAMMLEDILPTLKAPRGLDLPAYVEAILQRFRNPAIKHALAQIAWDGSQKLPFRILGTIADNLMAHRPIERLCVSIAAWMQFVRRAALEGRRVTDPLARELFEIGAACSNNAAADLPRFLTLTSVFPSQVATNPRFKSALARAYDSMRGGEGSWPLDLRDLLQRRQSS